MKIKFKHYTLWMLFVSITYFAGAQNSTNKGNVIVDNNGVMRWEKTKEEVKGFGVNYSVPFAHAYRSAKRMGIDPKQAIDNDVYHFTRLGFDLYRLHVWDTQISDVEGNLLENEYLDTFDYLLKKLSDHNINYVITPIAFWGDGWPEPNTETPGFSHKYGKDNCLTNKAAIKAQENYLYQFLNHVNPYKGVAYKNDPNVIAFEISNEPHHKGDANVVTDFVSRMMKAINRTKNKKPVFYNMSHAVHFADAYFKGGVKGGTFQWYPTGLGYQREISGNLLPNVNDYDITFEDSFKKFKGAKLVYEFDAADVGKSYIYPAMARSFRTAGIQIATHFAYDPTYLAYANTEYNTHYMNLVYTPQKALSLKICAEVFREIPMYADFGTYPENTTFENFKVDYLNDLAEYNTADKFIYTNSTSSVPKNESELREIAGYANSTLVKYDGTGAYFLDKIDNGLWRLEVLPDAIWVDNPFGRNSPNKTVGVVNWQTHQMEINLKDLGENFTIEAINSGNDFKPTVSNSNFAIQPGTYMVSRNNKSKTWNPSDAFKTNSLSSFFAPKTTVDKAWLKHEPLSEVSENSEIEITAQFVGTKQPEQLQIVGYSANKRHVFEMKQTKAYQYAATIPKGTFSEGFFNYYIVIKDAADDFITYPAGDKGQPFDWDFYERETYKIRVANSTKPIYLFNAIDDAELLVAPWQRSFKLRPTENLNEATYDMNIEKLFVEDIENLNAKPIYDYSFKHFVLDRVEGRRDDLKMKKSIVFNGNALNDKPCKLQIALVMNDGSAYGKVITIDTDVKDYVVSLSELIPVKTVTLPRPYPSFLPYYFEHNNTSTFDITKVESIQFSIGPELEVSEQTQSHGISVIHIRLE